MTILIVDDEELIRNVIKEYCINSNYQVLEASNGYDAVELIKKNDIDLIILDIMMPKMNGYKISRLLKFDNKYKNIPIIMLTARSQEEDKLIGDETGANEYITKPFDLEFVINKVNQYLKD